MSDNEQSYLEISTVGQLSLADAIVLVRFMGPTDAARFVSFVDPWRYPGEQAQASIGAKDRLQSAVDKATQQKKVF